jgi:hypothetical protein
MGVGGLAFVALAIVLVAVVPKSPSLHASAAELTSHYTKSKQGMYLLGGFVTMAAVVVGVFWFWYFRDLLAVVPGARRLASIGFAGALIFAVSGGIAAGLDFVLSDAAGHATPGTYQVLNYLGANLSLGTTAAGVVLFLLATGLILVRFRMLSVWLGWLSLLLALVTFLITPFGLLCIAIWMIPTNILLIARARSEAESGVATSV